MVSEIINKETDTIFILPLESGGFRIVNDVGEMINPILLDPETTAEIRAVMGAHGSTTLQPTTVPQYKSRRWFLGALAAGFSALVYEGGVRQWQDVEGWLRALGGEGEDVVVVPAASAKQGIGESGSTVIVPGNTRSSDDEFKLTGEKVTIQKTDVGGIDSQQVNINRNIPTLQGEHRLSFQHGEFRYPIFDNWQPLFKVPYAVREAGPALALCDQGVFCYNFFQEHGVRKYLDDIGDRKVNYAWYGVDFTPEQISLRPNAEVYSPTVGTILNISSDIGGQYIDIETTIGGQWALLRIHHLIPNPGLQEGDSINAGDLIAKVAPWESNNDNSHLHVGLIVRNPFVTNKDHRDYYIVVPPQVMFDPQFQPGKAIIFDGYEPDKVVAGSGFTQEYFDQVSLPILAKILSGG